MTYHATQGNIFFIHHIFSRKCVFFVRFFFEKHLEKSSKKNQRARVAPRSFYLCFFA